MAEGLMKGKTWKEHKHKLTYPVGVDLKYDEVRCHVIVHEDTKEVQFLSYAGKPLANTQEFSHIFVRMAERTGYYEFDCGIEINENFSDTYRWVRSTKGLPKDLSTATFRFWLFDLPGSTQPYVRRREIMAAVVESVRQYMPSAIATPEHHICNSEGDVDWLFEQVIERGVEGLMVKTYDHTYQRGKRTDGWLKYKPSEDADGIITELHEAICGKDQPELGLVAGTPLGRIGSVTIRLEDGSEATPHGIAHDLGTEMFLNPQAYLGEWCEFKYMHRDRQGGYRHPTFNRLREEK